jgi:hypothetical protein
MVNIRGELHLCVHLDLALGLQAAGDSGAKPEAPARRGEAGPRAQDLAGA